jgi:DNA-binding SARP family transcriptional activator
MLRLETLGGLLLTDSNGRQLVPQRRRLALLALLAGAGERGMTRDKLVGVLWPESASEHARHALEQLLYEVRRDLPTPIILGTDPLRLDPAAVTADVHQFSRLLAAGDLAGALALYHGPFLDGFFLQGTPEFERWADSERSRIEGERARALRLLADQAEARGQQTAEIEYRRLLAGTDPLGERAATELVRALAVAGDWAGATREARAYAARIRAELPGVVPPDLERLVDRLRREHETSPATPSGAVAQNPYVLERELGRGAVATVYLARDRRFDRPVALKLLRPDVATPTDARRFRREIAILARLYHPHILQLYDSGVLAGDGPAGLYFVMPYVSGESLRQRLRRESPLPLETAVDLATDLAEALAYAHGRGVVHRDLRPENVLLEAGHALLADFGIAGVLESVGGERLSASGIVLGHPGYCSPEQARGSRAIDGRSDIYSLGCVLYEMLSGEPAFTGATSAAIMARQMAGEVRPLRTVCPELPASLEEAVLRAMALQPENRYASAAEFGAALRAR